MPSFIHRYVITVPASATFLKKRERKLDADCRLHSSRLRQKTDVKAEAGHFSVIEVSLSEAIHPLWRCNEVPTASIATIITDSSLDNKHYHLHCNHLILKMATRIRRTGAKKALHLAMYVICLLSAYSLGLYSRYFLQEVSRALNPTAEFSPPQRGSLPDQWETFSFDQIYDHYECKKRAEDKSKPVPSLAQWLFLRKHYNDFVDDTVAFDDPVPPTLGYSFDESHSIPPFYAKLDPVRGRGLYASRDINAFELVHHWSGHDVTFPDAYAFRQFVFSLPKRMACDVVDWAWSRKMSENGPEAICLSINIASLMNSGGPREVNVSINSSSSDSFYATRFIKKDEEIMTHFVRT